MINHHFPTGTPLMDDTFRAPISVDLAVVDKLLTDVIPDWITGNLVGHLNLTFNMIHACTSDEQHRMMLVFPEETMAYTLFTMSRCTKFLANVSSGQTDELNRMMSDLVEIRKRRDREAQEAEENPEEKESQQAMH